MIRVRRFRDRSDRIGRGSSGRRAAAALVLALGAGLAPAPPARATGAPALRPATEWRDLLAATPGALAEAASAWSNPAMAAAMPGAEWQTLLTADARDGVRGYRRLGGFLAVPGFGLGVVHTRSRQGVRVAGVTDWRMALAGGDRALAVGIALGGSRGDTGVLGGSTLWQVGVVRRIGRRASLGLAGTRSLRTRAASLAGDVALRPLGDRRLTLFASAELARGARADEAPWTAGATIEPVPGILASARFEHDPRRPGDDAVRVTVAVATGAAAGADVAVRSVWVDGHRGPTTYVSHTGFGRRNAVLERLARADRFVRLEVRGPVRLVRRPWFDDATRLRDLLDELDGVRDDPTVAGVALSLSGAAVSPGSAWELVRAIEAVRRVGKRVVVFIDEAGMALYHVASAADRVVMDPSGMLVLPGFATGRTYVAELAQRLGVGVEEWRFREYKSALESFVRRDMSPQDREQRRAIVETFRRVFRDDVAAGRRVRAATVDRWIDDVALLTAQDARREGLVDTLARFADVERIVERELGRRVRLIGPRRTRRFTVADVAWGRRPRVAVVYAVGECAMDSGLRARRLARRLRRIARDDGVRAVVLRVDSPGGSVLASDVVADAVRALRRRKPVVVSQADVAASGGYWISVEADAIVARPTTITGSIGVIAGWVWDAGAGERMGLHTETVAAGRHADLFVRTRLPLLGVGLPHRRVDDAERGRILGTMQTLYDRFVDLVAARRRLPRSRAEGLARGRVWTGADALEHGLVDRLGGLREAVRLAAGRAGLDAQRVRVEYVDFARGVDLADLIGRLFRLGQDRGTTSAAAVASRDAPAPVDPLAHFDALRAAVAPERDAVAELRRVLRHNGRARCRLPAGWLPVDAGAVALGERPIDR